MASFASASAPPFSCRRSLAHSVPCATQGRLAFFSKSWRWGRRRLVLPVKCSSSGGPGRDAEPEDDTFLSTSSSHSSRDLAYKLCAGLGGVGFVETAYLTYLKLTNSDAFCPIGGGNCGDVLSSDYAVVFGTLLCLQVIVFFPPFSFLFGF